MPLFLVLATCARYSYLSYNPIYRWVPRIRSFRGSGSRRGTHVEAITMSNEHKKGKYNEAVPRPMLRVHPTSFALFPV